MRTNTKILLLITLSLVVFSCRAQVVQTPTDAKKLELNKEHFIGKPLKILLKEIKPEIKMAAIGPLENLDMTYFYFSFIERRRFVALMDENTPAITIKVIVSGLVITNPSEEYRVRRMSGFPWSKEDADKFGDYIIKSISVFGDESQ